MFIRGMNDDSMDLVKKGGIAVFSAVINSKTFRSFVKV
jgi:hypothetical protein